MYHSESWQRLRSFHCIWVHYLWPRHCPKISRGAGDAWKAGTGTISPWAKGKWMDFPSREWLKGDGEWDPGYANSPKSALLPLWLWAQGGNRAQGLGRGPLPGTPAKPLLFSMPPGSQCLLMVRTTGERGKCTDSASSLPVGSARNSIASRRSILCIFCMNLISK